MIQLNDPALPPVTRRRAFALVAGIPAGLWLRASAAAPRIEITGNFQPLPIAIPDFIGPDLAVALPGFEASFWIGIGAPKNTPAEIVDKLNRRSMPALPISG